VKKAKLSGLALAVTIFQLASSFSIASAQPDSGSVHSRKTIIQSTTTPSSSSSTETTVEQRGVMGIKHANVFVPKYKERLNTYAEQIHMGLTKGWLSNENATHFSAELDRLNALEAKVAAQNFAKPASDDLDKQITQFNIEFTNATKIPAVKPAPIPTTSAPTSGATSAKATTKTTTTKAAPKKTTKVVVKTKAKTKTKSAK